MEKITVEKSGILYENPLPQLKSRQAYFPSVIELSDGNLLAAYALGEAIESIDMTTVLAISHDKGKTWKPLGPIYDKNKCNWATSDTCKLTYISKHKVVALGYRFFRYSPELPISNPQTGGVLNNEVIFFESTDGGLNFGEPKIIPTSFCEPTEASAPIYVLSNKQWITPISNFLNWNGHAENGMYGRLLRTNDEGRTWDDNTVTMKLSGDKIAIWEQRACELEEGKILVISWVSDLEQNRRLPNHYVISENYGKKFGAPKSTGIMGEASNVYHLGNNKILSLHCMRRNTNKTGILACIVDLNDDEWRIINQQMIFEPISHKKNIKMHDAFSFLKFGQPSVTKLYDGIYYMCFWCETGGKSNILWNILRID
jgi:hypothetical protein